MARSCRCCCSCSNINDAVYPTTEIDNEGTSLTSTYNYQIVLTATADQAPPVAETYAPAQGFWAFTAQPRECLSAVLDSKCDSEHGLFTHQCHRHAHRGWPSSNIKTWKLESWNSCWHSAADRLCQWRQRHSNTIYYVNEAREVGDELLLTLSSEYQASFASNGIPIGGAGSPTPGSELSLDGAAGTNLSFGWINPVAQLGSSQLAGETDANTTLAIESDGSLVLSLSSFEPQANVQNCCPLLRSPVRGPLIQPMPANSRRWFVITCRLRIHHPFLRQ